MSAPQPSARTVAARLIKAVVYDSRSLSTLTPPALAGIADERDRAFVQACAYGVLRHYFSLKARLDALLERPLKSKDADIEALLIGGLFQIAHMDVPAHAAVSASVDAAKEMRKGWACPLVNAVLRNALRATSSDEDLADEAVRFEYPQWMIDRFRADWPDDWTSILRSSNRQASMTLRVNQKRTGVENYLSVLAEAGIEAERTHYSPVGVRLADPLPVTALPEFNDGCISVQDEAAQLAARLISVDKADRVLDACAAPGGKICHMLEGVENNVHLIAVDISGDRMRRVEENLQRLGLDCITRVADAGKPADWWDGEPYDRIVVDAPCTATGVMRRHPDIRLHRRPDDIDTHAAEQRRLLAALWPLLAHEGRLLYATCSIIPAENDEVVASLLEDRFDAKALTLPATWGRSTRYGRQILPGEDGMDGFYYALLSKGPRD